MSSNSQADDYLDTALADAWHATGELIEARLTADAHADCWGAHNGPDGPVDCDGQPI